MNHEELASQIQDKHQWIDSVKQEMSRVLVGQHDLVDSLIISLLCNGHTLLEGVPGLAKTLAIKSLSGCINAGFSRIQFTPDLLPADVIGTMIFNQHDATFSPKLGPVFSNLVLADEINRAPAKVQAALLEAMQERQVTIGEKSYPLPDPFLVLATQNPIDQEGTYPLPEAQLDRFLLKTILDYPTKQEELTILDRMATSGEIPSTKAVVSPEQITASRKLVNAIYIDPAVREYIVELIHTTRRPGKINTRLAPLIQTGASPRATINLALAARANAFTKGRAYVTPQDVKSLAQGVLRHRILLSYEAEAENTTTDQIIDEILSSVIVP